MVTPIITHLNREDCKFITWTQNDRTVKKRFYDTETDTDMENRSDPFEFDQLRFVWEVLKRAEIYNTLAVKTMIEAKSKLWKITRV